MEISKRSQFLSRLVFFLLDLRICFSKQCRVGKLSAVDTVAEDDEIPVWPRCGTKMTSDVDAEIIFK